MKNASSPRVDERSPAEHAKTPLVQLVSKACEVLRSLLDYLLSYEPVVEGNGVLGDHLL